MTSRRSFLRSIVAAVALAPVLAGFEFRVSSEDEIEDLIRFVRERRAMQRMAEELALAS